jgi:hypothetical protein
MIASALGGRDRRVLLLGGAVVALILVLGRVVPATLAYSADRQRGATAAAEQLAHTEWLVQSAPNLRRELDRVRRELTRYDSALVEGGSPSTASARLAEVVSDAVADADARLGSIRLSADTSALSGELAHVVAHATITGDLLSLATVLQALEEGPQLLAVTEVSIDTTQPRLARSQTEQLQAELVVDGLYRRAPKDRVR